tara:strand:- start:37 stop:363 length:327 start_codon:yes stop_codon:yes gene_type:complete
MQYIKQKSTGLAVYREVPHVSTTLTQAVRHTGIAIEDLEVVDEPLTGEEWNQKAEDARPWTEKMIESDQTLIPRWAEDMIDAYGKKGLAEQTLERYENKKLLRSERPA